MDIREEGRISEAHEQTQQRRQDAAASGRSSGAAASDMKVDLFSFTGNKYSSIICSQIQFGEVGNEEGMFKQERSSSQ